MTASSSTGCARPSSTLIRRTSAPTASAGSGSRVTTLHTCSTSGMLESVGSRRLSSSRRSSPSCGPRHARRRGMSHTTARRGTTTSSSMASRVPACRRLRRVARGTRSSASPPSSDISSRNHLRRWSSRRGSKRGPPGQRVCGASASMAVCSSITSRSNLARGPGHRAQRRGQVDAARRARRTHRRRPGIGGRPGTVDRVADTGD